MAVRLGEPFPLGHFHGTIVGVSQCRLESPTLADYVTEGAQLKDKESPQKVRGGFDFGGKGFWL